MERRENVLVALFDSWNKPYWWLYLNQNNDKNLTVRDSVEIQGEEYKRASRIHKSRNKSLNTEVWNVSFVFHSTDI